MAAAARNQRSWKNYLLNKRYQLRFTLFMTGLSALLMGLLGWWVKTQASRTTEIAINNVVGGADLGHCERPALGFFTGDDSGLGWGEAPALADDAVEADRQADTALDDDLDDPLAWGDEEASEDDGFADDDGAPQVVLGDIEGEIDEAEPTATATAAPAGGDVARYYECRMEQAIELAGLVQPIYRGERMITIVLVVVGVVLLIGITLYGIVMTHRVAGPLYKITLYLNKLKDGRYDTVYNLRKGDHLVAFYEHFKRAHAGLRAMQEEDLARLREAVEIADREGLAEASPKVAETLEEMRVLVEEKEKSLE